mgnify:FL=1
MAQSDADTMHPLFLAMMPAFTDKQLRELNYLSAKEINKRISLRKKQARHDKLPEQREARAKLKPEMMVKRKGLKFGFYLADNSEAVFRIVKVARVNCVLTVRGSRYWSDGALTTVRIADIEPA